MVWKWLKKILVFGRSLLLEQQMPKEDQSPIKPEEQFGKSSKRFAGFQYGLFFSADRHRKKGNRWAFS
jgi:hypothetical protein